MDFNKYIKEDAEGIYNLHFLNKDKLTKSQIMEIFSVYGKVLGLNTTKDKTGYRFIKYGTLDETIACIKGLQDGSKIQLLPEKSKINDRSNVLNTSQNSMYNHKFIPNITKENSSVSNEKSSFSSRQTSMKNNFSVTMDYGKYWRKTEKGFSIHFVNKNGLSPEYIKDMFSSYGTVVSICEIDNQNGLKIITYKTLDEVINCLKGLQNDSQISMLLEKNKFLEVEGKATYQNNSNQWQTVRMEDTSQKMFSTATTHHNKQEKLSEYRGKPFYSVPKLEYDCKSNADEMKHKNAVSQMFDGTCSSLQQKFINNEDQITKKKQEETKLYSSMKTDTDSKINKSKRFGIHDQKMPTLVSDAEMKPKESDVMSESSLSNKTNSSQVVLLQDVIVANIHENYGVHYILHLFEKYDPFSAIDVKTISKNNVRYCHVYFKTVQDAIAVEEEFDNFDLHGKKLIVLRDSRMMNERMRRMRCMRRK